MGSLNHHEEKVTKNDLIQFNHKIRKRDCKFGLIFSYIGYTQPCFTERNEIHLKDKTKIILFDLSDFEKIVNGV